MSLFPARGICVFERVAVYCRMSDAPFILEHEILKVIYIKTSYRSAGYMRGDGKNVPMFEREYANSYLHFGTLVDVLNCPKKYDDPAMKSMQGLIMLMEEINTQKYGYGEVSNAIEVLVSNGQVVDDIKKHDPKGQSGHRKIRLTDKGAIDYRDNFYHKERKKTKRDRFSRNVTYISLGIALVAGIIPLIIFLIERGEVKETQVTIPEAKDILQTQRDLQQSVQDLPRMIQMQDTSVKKVKIVK
jgi:hypothetical protein